MHFSGEASEHEHAWEDDGTETEGEEWELGYESSNEGAGDEDEELEEEELEDSRESEEDGLLNSALEGMALISYRLGGTRREGLGVDTEAGHGEWLNGTLEGISLAGSTGFADAVFAACGDFGELNVAGHENLKQNTNIEVCEVQQVDSHVHGQAGENHPRSNPAIESRISRKDLDPQPPAQEKKTLDPKPKPTIPYVGAPAPYASASASALSLIPFSATVTQTGYDMWRRQLYSHSVGAKRVRLSNGRGYPDLTWCEPSGRS